MSRLIRQRIINLIQSFMITFAIFNIGNFESGNILLVIIFGAAFAGINRIEGTAFDKRSRVISSFLAAILAFLYFLGSYRTIGGGLENPMFLAIYIMLTMGGLYSLIYNVFLALLPSLDIESQEINQSFVPRRWLCYMLIILICMLPVLMLNFPGVMTVDSLYQYEQVIGAEAFDNHHPWIHTLTIALFYNIGFSITGNVYAGIAAYTIAQMFIVACTYAYACECAAELGAPRWMRIVMLLIFVLCPFNLIFAITMWKDIIFGCGALLLTVSIHRVVNFNRCGKRDAILFTVGALITAIYRKNGLYAMALVLVAIVVSALVSRSRSVAKMGILGAVAIVITLTFNGPIIKAYGVEEASFVYKYAIPLQQIGRVVYEGCALTQEEADEIEKVNVISFIQEAYRPEGADNMLQWAEFGDKEYLSTHMPDFLGLWLRLGIKYPKEYAKAFIDITRGYYYPMNPQQTVYFGIMETNNLGLSTKPVISGRKLLKINEITQKLPTILPVYGAAYSMGSFFWILMALIAMVIIKRKYRQLLAILPTFAITASVIAAVPLVADLRYGYELMITLPFLVMIGLLDTGAIDESEQQ